MDTVDQDDMDVEEAASLVCYFIVGGDTFDTFELNAVTHELQASTRYLSVLLLLKHVYVIHFELCFLYDYVK